MKYIVPAENADCLHIGSWVEIFRACSTGRDKSPIRVQSMRVGGELLEFGPRATVQRRSSRPLRPHEGEIVSINRTQGEVLFQIRMDS